MTAPAGLPGLYFDAHAELRRATEPTHLALHGLPQFRAIADGLLGRDAYAELLVRLHGFHCALGGAARKGGLGHLSGSPLRIRRLEADLTALDHSPTVPAPIFAPSSAAYLHGALYVAEGSALGGRVIAPQLDYLFGEGQPGRTFFAGDAATGQAWRAFLASLRAAWPHPTALAELVAGAKAAFALFAKMIDA